MKNVLLSILLFSMFFVSHSCPAIADIVVHTSDFIANADRTNFNSFENLPSPGTSPFNTNGLWVLNNAAEAIWNEDGIVVSQVFTAFIPGNENFGIWTMHYETGGMAPDGIRNWYPNGGDDGFTKLTRSDTSDFSSIGFVVSSGTSADRYLYTLLNDGQIVLQGFVPHPDGNSYLGFSGGGFDEVLVRSANQTNNFFDGSQNGLSIDGIELTSVPEPSSMLLLAASMGIIVVVLRGTPKNSQKNVP